METLLDETTTMADPWLGPIASWTGQEEYPWQKTIVADLAAPALAVLDQAITREKLFG
jgi:hypothetical protein